MQGIAGTWGQPQICKHRDSFRLSDFAFTTFLGISSCRKSIFSTFTKVFSSHLMPRVHEWSNDDKFRKITKQKCQWSKTDERPWDADPSLSPRLTQHLWLVQESQAQGTDNQTSQIAPNHNPFGVVGNGLTLRGVRLWVLKFSVSDEGTLMPLGILLP